MPGHAAQDEQVGERIDDVDGLEPAGYTMAKHSWVNSSMMLSMRNLRRLGAVLDEVVGPDIIALLGSEPDARPIRQPQATAFGLLPGNLQPLASPDPLDPLIVDQPAGPAQQLGNLAIAVAAILPASSTSRR